MLIKYIHSSIHSHNNNEGEWYLESALSDAQRESISLENALVVLLDAVLGVGAVAERRDRLTGAAAGSIEVDLDRLDIIVFREQALKSI